MNPNLCLSNHFLLAPRRLQQGAPSGRTSRWSSFCLPHSSIWETCFATGRLNYTRRALTVSFHNFHTRKSPRRSISKPIYCSSSEASTLTLENTESLDPLRLAIKAVAVGKNGSKPIPEDLTPVVQEVLSSIENNLVADTVAEDSKILKAAFLGSLFMKTELHEHERVILAGCQGSATSLDYDPSPEETEWGAYSRGPGTCTALELLTVAAPSITPSTPLHRFALQLLNYEHLSEAEAERLFELLLLQDTTDQVAAFFFPVMRVRHEDANELTGITRALLSSRSDGFNPEECPPPAGSPVVHLSEPFDGVNRSTMITPLLAASIQKDLGVRVVTHMSDTSGPKYGPNTKEIMSLLPSEMAPRLTSNLDLQGTPAFGHYADQDDVSPALAGWRRVRQVVMKRPGLATCEKLLDSSNAAVVISSAFHPPYTEKMADVLERVGTPGMVILRKGLEGTLAFPLQQGRTAQILCSVRPPSGEYLRHEFNFGVEDAGEEPEEEESDGKRLGPGVPTATAIADLIEKYHNTGSSGDPVFDKRVRVTTKGIQKALQWVASKADIL